MGEMRGVGAGRGGVEKRAEELKKGERRHHAQ